MHTPWHRHISVLLLAVIGFSCLPAHLVHDLFANHTDQAENHCSYYHGDLGRHIEQQEDHCDLFKTNTPLYDVLGFDPQIGRPEPLQIVYKRSYESPLHTEACRNIPARAPPAA